MQKKSPLLYRLFFPILILTICAFLLRKAEVFNFSTGTILTPLILYFIVAIGAVIWVLIKINESKDFDNF